MVIAGAELNSCVVMEMAERIVVGQRLQMNVFEMVTEMCLEIVRAVSELVMDMKSLAVVGCYCAMNRVDLVAKYRARKACS